MILTILYSTESNVPLKKEVNYITHSSVKQLKIISISHLRGKEFRSTISLQWNNETQDLIIIAVKILQVFRWGDDMSEK